MNVPNRERITPPKPVAPAECPTRTFRFGAIVFLAAVLASGCYTQKIEKAFEGEFAPVENNRVIIEYCKRCHLHREFQASGHIDAMALEYRRKVFRYTTECRTCHYLEKKFSLNDFARKTRWPDEANQGKYSEFEREVLRSWRARKDSQVPANKPKAEAP